MHFLYDVFTPPPLYKYTQSTNNVSNYWCPHKNAWPCENIASTCENTIVACENKCSHEDFSISRCLLPIWVVVMIMLCMCMQFHQHICWCIVQSACQVQNGSGYTAKRCCSVEWAQPPCFFIFYHHGVSLKVF